VKFLILVRLLYYVIFLYFHFSEHTQYILNLLYGDGEYCLGRSIFLL